MSLTEKPLHEEKWNGRLMFSILTQVSLEYDHCLLDRFAIRARFVIFFHSHKGPQTSKIYQKQISLNRKNKTEMVITNISNL